MPPKAKKEPAHAPAQEPSAEQTATPPESDGSGSTSQSSTSKLKESLWPICEEIEIVHKGEKLPVFLRTGYGDVDQLLGNLRPGQVIVVAGRPSMGKTAFALNVAANAALDDNAPVLVFTLEDTKTSVVNRLITSEARVDSSKMRRGVLRDDEFVRLGRAAGILSHAPIWIDELHTRSFDEMVRKIRDGKRDNKIRLVVIDYLQLMEGPLPRADNRTQELSAMSRGLKGLAKELGVAILVLSQCSRAPEQRTGENKRPILTDIRDSGSIEEDADIVMLLYRAEMYQGPFDYDGNSIEGKAEVLIGKNRHGSTGIANLFFHRGVARFESYEKSAAATS